MGKVDPIAKANPVNEMMEVCLNSVLQIPQIDSGIFLVNNTESDGTHMVGQASKKDMFHFVMHIFSALSKEDRVKMLTFIALGEIGKEEE